jgi:hypothetical protein
MSYEEMEGLIARLSGERWVSDQRLEQLVIGQAEESASGGRRRGMDDQDQPLVTLEWKFQKDKNSNPLTLF